MEWIKIKAEHNSDELSDAQLGSLVRYQLLIARIGRTPTDKEIRRQTSIKTLRSSEEVLRNIGVTLEHIESKVIEDREQVNRKKEASKKTSSKYRAKKKSDTSPECHADITEKRREEKRREDIDMSSFLNSIIKSWEKHYPNEFRKDGKRQTSYVIARRKELEKLQNREQIVEYISTYHGKEVLTDDTIAPPENKEGIIGLGGQLIGAWD